MFFPDIRNLLCLLLKLRIIYLLQTVPRVLWVQQVAPEEKSEGCRAPTSPPLPGARVCVRYSLAPAAGTASPLTAALCRAYVAAYENAAEYSPDRADITL